MADEKRRYWAIRTDRDNKELLLGELRKGRLRQGWGYEASQDLRLIQAEITKGSKWWERLSNEQKQVLPHLRMLSLAEDSVQLGDWIVVPNLPEDGFCFVVEVSGEYSYDPLRLSKKQDLNDLRQDYGHILPIRILTENGINKYAEEVDATIRSTLRTPMRMWNLDFYGKAIERLIKDYKAGADLATARSAEARLEKAWELAWSHAADVLRERLGSELDARFQAAEWEQPIRTVLKNLYPGAEVRWVAGPRESGADLIVQIPNCFGELPWLIVVQVKNYQGEIGTAVLKQLRNAYDRYSKEGRLISLVVMTTAEKTSADFRASVDALAKDLNVPVQAVLRKEMMKIMSDGLFPRKV